MTHKFYFNLGLTGMKSKYFQPDLYYLIWVSWETNISALVKRNYCPFFFIVFLMHWLINVFVIITEKKLKYWCSMRTARESNSEGAATERFTRNDENDCWEKETTPDFTSAVETKASAVQFCNFDLESSEVSNDFRKKMLAGPFFEEWGTWHFLISF